MIESRIELTDRLRLEGRWDKANAYRERMRQEFRAQGMKRKEANEAAWQAARKAYPPLQPVGDTEPYAAGDGTPFNIESDGASLRHDILWVYNNLGVAKLKPDQAPSPGAFNLWVWARQYPHRFIEQMLPKALAMRDRENEPKDEPVDGVDVLELIEHYRKKPESMPIKRRRRTN